MNDTLYWVVCVFVFKQKTAYEMRISDWSSDVCSSDLLDILSSDYYPASLLQAALGLAEQDNGYDLPRAIATISLAPARAAGLDDRGEIAVGLQTGSASCRDRACQYA